MASPQWNDVNNQYLYDVSRFLQNHLEKGKFYGKPMKINTLISACLYNIDKFDRCLMYRSDIHPGMFRSVKNPKQDRQFIEIMFLTHGHTNGLRTFIYNSAKGTIWHF